MRRLITLVKGLPDGSALHRSVDPAGASWTQDHELLAAILEATDDAMRVNVKMHGGRIDGPPRRVRRPHQPAIEKPKGASVAEIRAFFERRR